MDIIRVVLVIVQAGLWRIGGAGKEEISFARSWYRDVLIPVINFFYFWLTMDFLTGILTGGATNIIRMGYGAYDPEHDDKPSWLAKITRDRDGWRIRMIYGAITSAMIGLFPAIYYFRHGGENVLAGYFLYCLLNVFGEFILNITSLKKNVWVVEPLTGAGRALVFFLCR